ncbi:MAG TPA: ABC transporter permease [Terriglobales bacterium]|nr:ABC transporter permease [Terriglobales bacterium]
MLHIGQDIRYALRTMRKSPGFVAVAVVTLALGIGANTAIFTVVNAVFFNPIPVHDPNRLLSLFTTDQRNRGGLNNFLPVSYPNGEDIQRRTQSFSGVALEIFSTVSMTVNGHPDTYNANLATGNFFDVLGVKPALGRTFRPDEDREAGAGPVIVLNHGFWERKFAANPNVIGQNVLLNGQGFTIIGVAPRGFQGTAVLGGPDMWVPMSMHDQVLSGFNKEWFNDRRFLGTFPVARLKPGVTEAQARAELQALGSDLQREFPVPNTARSFTSLPLLQSAINPNLRGLFTRAGALMMTVVGLVLLIACANIANLLLARAAGRKREISIRLAVGASRSRIVAQLLTEATILAVAGGAMGIGLALLGRNLLWQYRPPFLQQSYLSLALDGRVLLFTLCIALGTGLIFGLAPALQATRPNLVLELKERAGGEVFTGRRFGLRHAFIVAQVALCMVALIGAGLFLLSLRNAQETNPGFNTQNLAMLSFDLGSLNYDPPRVKEFQRRTLETVQSMPGVQAATLASDVPLFGGGFSRSVFPEGQEGSSSRNGVLVTTDQVATGYLQTLGIPLMRGRDFDTAVREESPKVAVINETAAHRFWPDQDPVGKRFKFYGESDFVQVIGVAHDAKYVTLGEDPQPFIYLPLVQNPSPAVTLFFRTTSNANNLLGAVRKQVQALDPNLPLINVWPIGEVIHQALWAARFSAGLLSIFAFVAVLLCAVGIYGVVGYTVGLRVREIGIRLALGARPRDVALMILRQSATTLSVGLAIGLVCAFVLARFISNLLYGMSGTSPAAFFATALLLAAIGVLASYVPARRAAGVDPLLAVRNE